MKSILRFGFWIRWLLILFFQVFVFNSLTLFDISKPFFYLYLILVYPLKSEKWVYLLYAFLTGLVIDVFYQSPGIHAAACVLIAFLRDFILQLVFEIKDDDAGLEAHSRVLGFTTFIIYISVLTFLHHSVFFLLDGFDFKHLFFHIFQILLNALFSLILIMTIEYLFYYRYNEK